MSIFDTLTALANAIRAKTGGTAALTLEQMTAAVESISGDSPDLPRAEAVVLSSTESGAYLESGGSGLQFVGYLPAGTGSVILDESTKITLKIPSTAIGNAAASDVRSGKTFTSALGLMLTGTMEVS